MQCLSTFGEFLWCLKEARKGSMIANADGLNKSPAPTQNCFFVPSTGKSDEILRRSSCLGGCFADTLCKVAALPVSQSPMPMPMPFCALALTALALAHPLTLACLTFWTPRGWTAKPLHNFWIEWPLMWWGEHHFAANLNLLDPLFVTTKNPKTLKFPLNFAILNYECKDDDPPIIIQMRSCQQNPMPRRLSTATDSPTTNIRRSQWTRSSASSRRRTAFTISAILVLFLLAMVPSAECATFFYGGMNCSQRTSFYLRNFTNWSENSYFFRFNPFLEILQWPFND